MNHRMKFLLAMSFGLAVIAGGTAHAHGAFVQRALPTSDQLRATGKVGEQASGFLGLVGEASPELRASVNAVNIRRRAAYADLARRRGVTIEEVGATMACELFATSILPGQYYRLPDGVWRRREGNAPVLRPAYCV